MTEKAIERYAVTNLVDAYWPDPSGSWMRYDAELVRDAMRWRKFRDNWDESEKLHMIANGTDHYDAAIDRAIASVGVEGEG
jgi:hypothetical protein